MKVISVFFLFILNFSLFDNANTQAQNKEDCKSRVLSREVTPTRLNSSLSMLFENISIHFTDNSLNMNVLSKFPTFLWSLPVISGVLISDEKERVLMLKVHSELKIIRHNGVEGKRAQAFWDAFSNTPNGWGKPFKECEMSDGKWFYVYVASRRKMKIGLFVNLYLDPCDIGLAEVFGELPTCDDTQECRKAENVETERGSQYRCVCRSGYFYAGSNNIEFEITGKQIERGEHNNTRCRPCPQNCSHSCNTNGTCLIAQEDPYLRTCIIIIQLVSMGVVLCLVLIIYRQRKTKAIAIGMWTILEIILLGKIILFNTVIVRSLKPSILRCLLEPWIREIGFIVCYGAIMLKLYRHLVEFRTRKAHRWVVKDTDLLKYLLIMLLSGMAYMAAFTALSLNFVAENYSILETRLTNSGEQFQGCKYLWWDFVTEGIEMAILVFGIHLAYASRNARTQFHERSFLCASLSIEFATSIIFYSARISIFQYLHPDTVLIIYCIRSQLSQTVSLFLIFFPKFWYQHKQVRSLAQEYSCRFPLDAFKDPSLQKNLSGNSSDVEIGEYSIADMSPDDIRAELKRLYLQLEMFKAKDICKDNPHISKRRGGRKTQHRRFSLQKKGSKDKVKGTMHSKHKDKDGKRDPDTEITEAEPSRTPEDSVCSIEGPSAIYADLPSANQIV